MNEMQNYLKDSLSFVPVFFFFRVCLLMRKLFCSIIFHELTLPSPFL